MKRVRIIAPLLVDFRSTGKNLSVLLESGYFENINGAYCLAGKIPIAHDVHWIRDMVARGALMEECT